MNAKSFGAALLLIVLLAGCAAAPQTVVDFAPTAAPDPAAPQANVDDEHGGLVGFVSDDSLNPIPDAEVILEGLGITTNTDGSGRFAFSLLNPAKVRVLASHPNFEIALQEVEILPGDVAEVRLQLVPLPSTEPYHVLHQGTGRIMCGISARPGLGVGVCQILTTAVGSASQEPRVDIRLSTQNFSHVITLVLETTWEPSQFGAGGLHVTWEHAQNWDAIGSGTERRIIFGQVNGHNPLQLILNQTQIAEFMDDPQPKRLCSLYGECTLMGIGYAHSATLGASSPADAGAYVDQPFTHFVTEFFVDSAPADYTAIIDT